jgi:hypothetical protein
MVRCQNGDCSPVALDAMVFVLLLTWLLRCQQCICSAAALDATVAMLRRKDAMGYTTVVAAGAGASLGERYAAVATACALGERARDQGGHALVVIDDLACMVRAHMRSCLHG